VQAETETVVVQAEPPPRESVSIRQVPPRSMAPKPAEASATMLPWGLAAGAGVLLLLGAMGWWRARRVAPIPEGVTDDFDAELESARNQALADPRVTADVIKLWMHA